MADSFTTNNNWTKPEVGASADTWGTKQNADLDNQDAMMAGLLYGLTLSAAGSTGTFGIATGAASGMALASAYTKTTGSWAVGTGNGSLDTGSIATGTWYHVWLIQRIDTGVVDVLTSLSVSSPTMPTNYTRKRRIGSMLTDGSSHWVAFTQNGNRVTWKVPVASYNGSPTSGAAVLEAMTLPPGINAMAHLRFLWSDSSSNGSGFLVNSPSETSTTVSSPGGNVTGINPTIAVAAAGEINTLTDTSAQIRIVTNTSTGTLILVTHGWDDLARGTQ